ncbi:WecB/TagA/CpsF family glycosyltransferase [Mucilaginibacter flavus]|uniref:WecB/TagA/CpsF family glycosyltransferase n=1 Tax=Mucilaginibacter flavus TaxID=931504 RepID=UPI0025B4385B|nr:WecB/TagA/CpsF family glycosyltransferase [Mucilaginibacter flavus]MDN3583744.1 WecB/TagA/CpsF family glycosyltransferase [Mucilaginibacter flavus]
MGNEAWDIIMDKVGDFKIAKGITSFVNPYSMLVLKSHRQIAESIDYWNVDGISLVNKINKYLQNNISRFSFDETSVAPLVFEYASRHNLKIAIIGTKEEYITNAILAIEEKHEVKISYYRNGYFDSEEEEFQTINKLINLKIDLVICGMGTPYQELFLIKLKKASFEGYMFTCGGYLHQISQKKEYYPDIFDRLNVRWIYRIISEPQLLKRYGISYPKFFFLFKKFAKIKYAKGKVKGPH